MLASVPLKVIVPSDVPSPTVNNRPEVPLSVIAPFVAISVTVWLVLSTSEMLIWLPLPELKTLAVSLVAVWSPGTVFVGASFILLTAMAKAWSACEPSLEEARTVMASEASLSRSICEPLRTVTTPVPALIWKAPWRCRPASR